MRIFRMLLALLSLCVLTATSVAQGWQENQSLDVTTKELSTANKKLQKELSRLEKKLKKRLSKAYPEIPIEQLDSMALQKLKQQKEDLKVQATDSVKSYLQNLRSQLVQDIKQTPEKLPVSDEIKESIQKIQSLEKLQGALKDPQQLTQALDIKELKGLETRAGSVRGALTQYQSEFEGWEEKLLSQVTSLPEARLLKEKLDRAKSFKPLPDTPLGNMDKMQSNDFVKEKLEAKAEELKRLGAKTLQEKFDAAQSRLNEAKEKFQSLEGDGFKQKQQPQKGEVSFLKKLRLGGNLQINHQKPTSVNAALRLTYPLSRKASVGIAGAGRLFLQKPAQHLPQEGQLNFRAFSRYDVWQHFYVQANYEFTRLGSGPTEFGNNGRWVQNALAGVGKRVKLTSKITMDLTAFYDFFYNPQTSPNLQPWVFRVGFDFGRSKR